MCDGQWIVKVSHRSEWTLDPTNIDMEWVVAKLNNCVIKMTLHDYIEFRKCWESLIINVEWFWIVWASFGLVLLWVFVLTKKKKWVKKTWENFQKFRVTGGILAIILYRFSVRKSTVRTCSPYLWSINLVHRLHQLLSCFRNSLLVFFFFCISNLACFSFSFFCLLLPLLILLLCWLFVSSSGVSFTSIQKKFEIGIFFSVSFFLPFSYLFLGERSSLCFFDFF